ncbi:MAG: HPF/RaiA family ribosome-associated protein, partial [Acidobacteria bacterium]|nr:HPF/RaiA family ribosome-associated protein [Acidobacteriota bacterium]
MRLAITGRQIDVTPALRQLISKRLVKLERILNDRAV